MSYSQEIYDAVRSKISNGDIGSAIRQVAYEMFDWSHTRNILQQEFLSAAYEMQRPSVLYRPELTEFQFSVWKAKYGDVCGIGDNPANAMIDFDKKWVLKQETTNGKA
jgi:hypothetical protein